ncbi:MAG: SLC13 family permease [Bacteroidetes bacterium]|nr:MAG: SLC13 family permease [Bacteroidota bacterium]
MTIEIILVFFILLAALVLFFTGWVRMDIVALLVLGTLAITGLVSPAEALSGFSNPAVVTVWAMFILSASLYQTGVARIIGRQVLNLAGTSEWRMIFVIMLTSGLLSAVMNNIGVAALMLPVVMDIARSTNRAPSRLLMPLAYGCLLGGLTTLIGTPPNLLVSFALQDADLIPFELFDFTPVGMGVMLGGIIFISLVGRHFLPHKDVAKNGIKKGKKALPASYDLEQRTFLIRVKPGSELDGKTLAESRLRAALGINVLSVKREGGGTMLDPGPDTIIRGKDKLFVQGRYDAIKALSEWKILLPEQSGFIPDEGKLSELSFFEAKIGEKSPLIGHFTAGRHVLKQINLNIIALKRGKIISGHTLKRTELQPGDVLLLHGPEDEIQKNVEGRHFESFSRIPANELMKLYKLHEALFIMEIKEDSELFGSAIAETQLGEAFGLNVLGILRSGDKLIMPKPGEKFEPGDRLLVQGNIKDLPLLQGLMEIDLPEEQAPAAQSLETGEIIMAEVVLAPRSLLAGKTLREINFRKKYGVTVLAIWREGRAYRTNLHNIQLRFGEALLLYGKRDKLELMGSDNDFILLTDTMSQPFRTHKALTAVIVMLGILIPVLLGIIPLAISAVIGIALMVLTGCLKMEEAYRAIEWRSVFLIAGLLPLGFAMEQTGAAALMAEQVVEIFGRFGPWGVIAGLYLLTLISTLAIPPAALVVIMSPVALQAAAGFDFSPYTIMMAISIAAAASFLSPISHPANLLVMGPGGYKFSDYIKLGLPLSLVVMIIAMVLLPIFWPL